MTPKRMGGGIIWLDSVDSTNNEAARRLDSLDNMSVIAASSQVAGRGQGDHIWLAEPGMNLTCSLVLKYSEAEAPPCSAEFLERMNGRICLAICEVLARRGIVSHVKLPNDIWVGDRKICGLLIENSVSDGRIRSTIVGIGLNVNQTVFPDSLPNPVSVRQLTGAGTDIPGLLRELRDEIGSRMEF